MTKVQMRLRLEAPLDKEQLARIGSAHGIYGIGRLLPEPSGDFISVDYDASRLTPREVKASLRKAGIAASAVHEA